MSVALISAVDPYPTDAGKKIMLAGFLDYFADRFGPENVHYIKVGSPPIREDFPATPHTVPGPSRAAVIGSIATRVTTGRSSLQEAFLGSRRTGTAINRILDDIGPQLQVYDTVRMAQYASAQVAAQQICYLDDLFSERYDRMLKATKQYPDIDSSPLGNFAEHVPRRLRSLGTNKTTQTALLRLERSLVRRSEDRVARTFRRCLLVNQDEVGVLTRRAGLAPGRIQCVPPLLAAPPSPDRGYRGAPEFVFLGDLGLSHNDDGVRWLLRDIWPLVLSRLPDAHLRVIGLRASTDALALAAEHRRSVSMDGYVPDLGDALGQAAALINPLRFGSGIKLKVIEALSRALPVVSTPVGAEGIASGPDQGVLLGGDPAEIADLLCSLTDPARNDEQSGKARSHFLARYSRQAVFEAYDRAFGPPATR